MCVLSPVIALFVSLFFLYLVPQLQKVERDVEIVQSYFQSGGPMDLMVQTLLSWFISGATFIITTVITGVLAVVGRSKRAKDSKMEGKAGVKKAAKQRARR